MEQKLEDSMEEEKNDVIVKEVVATEAPEDTIIKINKGELDNMMNRLTSLREAVTELKKKGYYLQSPSEKYKLCSGIAGDLATLSPLTGRAHNTTIMKLESEVLTMLLSSYKELLEISIAK